MLLEVKTTTIGAVAGAVLATVLPVPVTSVVFGGVLQMIYHGLGRVF